MLESSGMIFCYLRLGVLVIVGVRLALGVPSGQGLHLGVI